MIDNLLPQASSFAADVDNLFVIITVVVGFWYFATLAMFLYPLWRYRAREGVPAQYITGKEPEMKRWITIPHALIIVCDVGLIFGAVRVWYNVKQHMPEPDHLIGVNVQQWAWTFVHAGPDGQLDTEDDIATVDQLHVEIGKTYHFRLQSRDVNHSFSIPAFRFKQDAIPGRAIMGWFQPTMLGTFDVQCAEMCGIGHGIMSAVAYVETAEEHAAWLASQNPVAAR